MTSTYARVVDWIDGALNLRDFGGYPTRDGKWVRSGVLFRSGGTHGISTAGLARLSQELGVRTVIDLRSDQERRVSRSPFEEHGIRVVHEPLDSGQRINFGVPSTWLLIRMARGEFDWVEVYWSLLHRNGDRFVRILDLLGQPGSLPVLVHCSGGRDRTGVTVALIQAALGVSDVDIAEDYALSSTLLERIDGAQFERLFGHIDVPREDLMSALATRPETMREFLRRICRDYRDVRVLLALFGADSDTVERLRSAACTSGC
jgi:protein-tyrosine phosphatase